MANLQLQLCTICGEQKNAGQVWFLVVENQGDDKLRVLHWQEKLANRRGVHRACCPAHVLELVTYWMTLGNLDHLCNLAVAALGIPNGRIRSALPTRVETNTATARLIAELAVDRESLNRAFDENPQVLQTLLDELSDTLEQEASKTHTGLQSRSRVSSANLRPL